MRFGVPPSRRARAASLRASATGPLCPARDWMAARISSSSLSLALLAAASRLFPARSNRSCSATIFLKAPRSCFTRSSAPFRILARSTTSIVVTSWPPNRSATCSSAVGALMASRAMKRASSTVNRGSFSAARARNCTNCACSSGRRPAISPITAARRAGRIWLTTIPKAASERRARPAPCRTRAEFGGNSASASGRERSTFATSIGVPVPSDMFRIAARKRASAAVQPAASSRTIAARRGFCAGSAALIRRARSTR